MLPRPTLVNIILLDSAARGCSVSDVHIKTSSQVAEAKPQHGEVRSHVKTKTVLYAKQDQESVQEVHKHPASTGLTCMSEAHVRQSSACNKRRGRAHLCGIALAAAAREAGHQCNIMECVTGRIPRLIIQPVEDLQRTFRPPPNIEIL